MSGARGPVAVFCGSRSGHDPAALEAARALGAGLARLGRTLVYGGGRIGLMGALADATLRAGGDVIGVIPGFLQRREVMHEGVDRLEITPSMHARKERMAALATAFVTLPGGLGTMDETFEMLTWRQLGLHDKPIHVLAAGAGAAALLALIDATIESGFAGEETRRLFDVAPDVPTLLDRLR